MCTIVGLNLLHKQPVSVRLFDRRLTVWLPAAMMSNRPATPTSRSSPEPWCSYLEYLTWCAISGAFENRGLPIPFAFSFLLVGSSLLEKSSPCPFFQEFGVITRWVFQQISPCVAASPTLGNFSLLRDSVRLTWRVQMGLTEKNSGRLWAVDVHAGVDCPIQMQSKLFYVVCTIRSVSQSVKDALLWVSSIRHLLATSSSSSKTVRKLTVHLPLSNISVRSRQNSSRPTSGHLTSQRQHIHYSGFLVVPRRLLSTLVPRPTGLLCGRPVALELSTRQLERSGSWQKQLQMSAEDAFIYT